MRYTATNVTTFVMLALTVWVMINRFRAKPDNNWPLFYYLAVVAYHQSLPERLNPYLIYVGVVTALLMRFEFMGGGFLGIIRFFELCALAGLAYQFFFLIFS